MQDCKVITFQLKHNESNFEKKVVIENYVTFNIAFLIKITKNYFY